MTALRAAPTVPVFDIGGVLIDWNPRYLYAKLFDEAEAMERFLAEVCTPAWNLEQDRGRPWPEAVALLAERHPQQADLIRAYDERWDEMVTDAFWDTVALLERAKARGPVHAITNFSRRQVPPRLRPVPVPDRLRRLRSCRARKG